MRSVVDRNVVMQRIPVVYPRSATVPEQHDAQAYIFSTLVHTTQAHHVHACIQLVYPGIVLRNKMRSCYKLSSVTNEC
jgi:hypothetical protein